MVNVGNVTILQNIDFDVLKQTHSQDIIKLAVETITNHAEHLLQEDVVKVVESHSVIDDAQNHTQDELFYADLCIYDGIC